MLMTKKLEFPSKIITLKEGLEIVNELIGFFTRKLQIIQNKMKILSRRIEPCIPLILDDDKKLKD